MNKPVIGGRKTKAPLFLVMITTSAQFLADQAPVPRLFGSFILPGTCELLHLTDRISLLFVQIKNTASPKTHIPQEQAKRFLYRSDCLKQLGTSSVLVASVSRLSV